MRIAIVGITGLLGRRLATALVGRGDEVVGFSRREAAVPGARVVRWDPMEGPMPFGALDGVDAVVNLAGEPLDGGRWTAARKRAIRDSRVVTTRRVVEALGYAGPRIVVNASAVGYYAAGDHEVDESSPRGEGFLAETVAAWEAEAEAAQGKGVRVVCARFGVVLAGEGGALPRMALPVKLLVGGPVGGGRQWMPWVHADDAVGLVLHALDRDELSGPLNVTAPQPARQREMVQAIASALGRVAIVPTPAFAVRLALGEMADLILTGQRVVPKVALGSEYRFTYPDLEPAVRAELAKEKAAA